VKKNLRYVIAVVVKLKKPTMDGGVDGVITKCKTKRRWKEIIGRHTRLTSLITRRSS